MIKYPSYIPVFNQNKTRSYPSESELLQTNPHLQGMSTKTRKQMQRHHVDLDRSNGKAENLHVIDGKTHTQLHQQLQQFISEFIKKGIIGYDRKNPHYYIADQKVLEQFEKPKPIEDSFQVEEIIRFPRLIGEHLADYEPA